MTEFVSKRLETIVEKGENAGYQHFLPFPLCFLIVWFPENSDFNSIPHNPNF